MTPLVWRGMPGRSRKRLRFSGLRDSLFFRIAVPFYVGPVQAFAGNQLGVEWAAEWGVWSGRRLPGPFATANDPAARTRVSVFDSQEER